MNYKVTLGSAENGKELVWSVRTNPHAYLSGKSGSGKSYKLRELIAQLPGQGIRCIVCDCSNDLSFALKEGFGANLPLDVLDLRSGEFSMNPLESMQLTEEEWESAVDISSRFAETLRAAYHLHDAQMVYLSNAAKEFLMSGRTPRSIHGLISYIRSDLELLKRTQTALYRLENLAGIVRCGEYNYDWKKQLSSPGITVIKFDTIQDEFQQSLLVELLLGQLWNQKMEIKDGIPVVLVLDECQKFRFRDSGFLMKILREGRKYNIAGWFSSQWVSDKNAVAALNQADLQLYFQPAFDHAHTLARRLSAGEKKRMIQYEKALTGLGVGQFIYKRADGNPIISKQLRFEQ